ncbi:hypothetical protein KY316_03665, partial [Candidatus Woesearchaeota archaeon]|nr:hypothetical protein [Candidatus Woesearchaeota archaeon]
GLFPSNQGFGLYINGAAVYENPISNTGSIASAPRLLSGIMENRSSTGYIARSYVVRAKKNTQLIIMGDVVSSSVRKPAAANNGNVVNITYNVDLPENATIHSAEWFIESAWTDNLFKAWVNGVYVPGSAASGSKLLTGLKNYFHAGHNTATGIFTFGSGGYEAGDDGASHIVINYSTDILNTFANKSKKYLYDVKSSCSIKYKKPVYVLGNLEQLNIDLHLQATNVTLYYVVDGTQSLIGLKNVAGSHVSWSDAEIKAAMQDDGIYYQNLSDKYIWFVFEVDTYHWRELVGAQRRIYSDSYVEVKTDFNPVYEYGYIDITSKIPIYKYSVNPFSGFYQNLEWRYFVPDASVPTIVDSQIAWLYWTATNPNQEAWSNHLKLYSHPPQPLIQEFARFGFSGAYIMPNQTNIYTLNFTAGYAANPFNSLVAFTFLIKGMVPYGQTFDTEEEAVDDAVDRLKDYLGDYVDATVISNETITMGGLPYLWGPAITEVRVWQ